MSYGFDNFPEKFVLFFQNKRLLEFQFQQFHPTIVVPYPSQFRVELLVEIYHKYLEDICMDVKKQKKIYTNDETI